MGSYKFKWPYTANEVIVTGTFDNWARSLQLENKGRYWEKTVPLGNVKSGDKVLYKFVVNGEWRTDTSHPVEKDHEGNENNVLDHDLIIPDSPNTTSAASGAETSKEIPKPPGAFPETPAADNKQEPMFSATPLPATSGAGNPINLKPGEAVPDSSTLTDNTVGSTVTTDKESYERGPGGGLSFASASGQAGSDSPAINSVAPGSTSSLLAGQQPIEPRGTPQVLRKEDDKDDEVSTPKPIAGAQSDGMTTGEKIAGGVAAAGAVAAGAAVAANEFVKEKTGTDAVAALPESAQSTIKENAKEAEGTTATSQPTSDGLTFAKKEEPAGITSTAQDTPAVATEGSDGLSFANQSSNQGSGLFSSTLSRWRGDDTADATKDESSGLTTTEKIGGGVAAAGVAAAGAAVAANEVLKDKTGTDAVAALPESTQQTIGENAKESTIPEQVNPDVAARGTTTTVPEEVTESQKEAGQDAEAAANPEAVTEKSAFEKELLAKVPTNNETGEAAPVAGVIEPEVPREVTESQKKAGEDAEAAASPEAVHDKSDMEKELLAKVPTAEGKGEPAPTETAATATRAPEATTTTTAAASDGLNASAASSAVPAATKASNPALSAATIATAKPAPAPAATTAAAHSAVSAESPTPATATTTPSKPQVTSGVASSSTPATSTPNKRHSMVERLRKPQESPAAGSSSSTEGSAAGSPSSKSSKRRSFFGRLKDKLSSVSVTQEAIGKQVQDAGMAVLEDRRGLLDNAAARSLSPELGRTSSLSTPTEELDIPRGRSDLADPLPQLREVSPLMDGDIMFRAQSDTERAAPSPRADYRDAPLTSIRTAELNDSSIRGLSGVAGPAMQRVNAAQKALARLERS